MYTFFKRPIRKQTQKKKHYETKKQTNKPYNIYCWPWGLPFSVVCMPKETPLEKTNIPSTHGYQSEKASRLGLGLVSPSPLCTGIPSGVDLCRPWESCNGLHPPGPLQSFHSLICRVPWVKGLMETPHLGLSVPRSLTVCTRFSGSSLYLFSSTAGDLLLWWWASRCYVSTTEDQQDSLCRYVPLAEQQRFVFS